MRILLVTADIGSGSGWNRYAWGVMSALRSEGHTVQAIVSTGARHYRDYASDSLRILPGPTSLKRNTILFPLQVMHVLASYYGTLSQCDVVHCVVEPYAPFAWLLATILRKPLIITAHGSFAVKPFVLHRAERFFAYIFCAAHTIVCVSEFTRARVLSYVPRAHAVVIHNGVDVREISQTDGAHPLVLCVGAIKYRKGFHLLLEAFAKVASRIPEAECVMVGERDEELYTKKLESRVAELGLAGRVRIVSDVDDAGLERLYERARVFVLAPVSTPDEFEGFGLVYLEANMHGVPTIGMAGSGAPEAIKDGVSGYVVPEGDVEVLAGKIEAILTQDNLWRTLSVGAKKWAKEYSWTSVAKQLGAIYQ